MSALGLLMFVAALAMMIATGAPAYAVLLGVSSLFAAIGVGLGVFDFSLLSALPLRLVGLLEHDLLQALPLYAFIGAWLNRLPLTDSLLRSGERLLARSSAPAELSALCVGALLAPMNGSVGASLHSLSRSVAPALAQRGVAAAPAAATICVASTLGVVIAPSLVLLLLGDAMMRAHTEAVNITHAAVRIVNTQDVVRAALVPGLLVWLLAMLLTAWRRRGTRPATRPSLSTRQALSAAATALVIAALLTGVALGRLYAVEAAATGCVLLLGYAACSGQIDRSRWRAVLHDTMVLSGLLMALLVAATTFSLVLRGFGTDALLTQSLSRLAGQPQVLMLVVMAGLVLCSFVLDAFEMIFLVIPLVMPPLLMAVPDPAWVAVVTLLVLQTGFLLPPFGYAVLMARRLLPGQVSAAELARALRPQLLLQAALIGALMVFPKVTQWARPTETAPSATTPADDARAEQLMRDAIDAQRSRRAPASP